ncbi:MAG: hypothetical protein IVW54_05000 [Candidatus Binataceae bacterium]|nr:hypothetical protein [Candidatus Binataceae bacterium]
MTSLAMLYRSLTVLSTFVGMLLGFVVIGSFVMGRSRMVMFSGFVMALGSIHMMLRCWMF